MQFNQWKTGLVAGLAFIVQPLWAQSTPIREQLQVPQCLAAKIRSSYQTLAENKQYKIIDIASDEIENLARLADEVRCGRFVNVTHRLQQSLQAKPQAALKLLQRHSVKSIKTEADNYEIHHEKEVKEAIAQVDEENIWQTLTHLTSYFNRSATKNTGVETAEWLKAQFEKMAVENGRQDTAAYFVKTGFYKQPSLVTVIGKDIQAPAVVIGAHMDTLDGRMPGAGDDGSGSSSLMEAARVLLASTNVLNRPVYIIWYSAEERGLVGSQYVVEHFSNKSIPVRAVVQLDMTGFRNDPHDPTMWVFTDYTDKKLSTFIADLIKTYIKVPVKYSHCGYGCSDHASWHDIGIPAAFPCETSFEEHNPYIHSSSDTMDLLSREHMANFSKLALAFAIELASA
ncbi:aminopeptidase LapA [Legionella israelensis]|uniref:Aminopeptidase n=1 Tax=Legionella israelensis TaxID=454 RepID=A0A0W0W4X2_9GAMM|nr:M28 family peptidase [Legionella israelensis]KTD26950.1 aminopeptidase [Legionella israelensis]QBS09946.1 M28 family peptidase [Legionella israelensis]SCY29142.1 leucyl aminopeptidase [Legionella israelensis DSM 19235]STX59513.1 aminopeptidase [Legionella israelensis]